MKVAILVPSSLKKTDGNTVRARRVISIIGGRFDTTVLAGTAQGEVTRSYAGVPVQSFFRFDKSIFMNPFKLARANFLFLRSLLSSHFDVVYAEGLYFLPSLFLAARLVGTRFIFEAHALAHKERAQVSSIIPFLLLVIEALIGRSAAAIVALSGETQRFFARVNKRTLFVPVFVDTSVYKNGRHDFTESQRKTVGLVGPFKGLFNKGQIEFVMKNLERFDRRISFALIGELDMQLDSEKVRKTGFLQEERDYASTLVEMDALMVPVQVGTFGPKNKMIEAMACGVPVFTTPAGVIGLDFARPGENIFVCEEEKLVDTINKMLFAKDRMAEVSSNARKMVEDHYSLEVCGRSITNIIEMVSRHV